MEEDKLYFFDIFSYQNKQKKKLILLGLPKRTLKENQYFVGIKKEREKKIRTLSFLACVIT